MSENYRENGANLKQGAPHQTKALPVPHACAQSYHEGSGCHGKLSGQWTRKIRASKTIYRGRDSFKRQLHTTQ